MAYMKDIHLLFTNGEKYSIDVRRVAVEKLPHFKREGRTLWGKRTPLGKLGK